MLSYTGKGWLAPVIILGTGFVFGLLIEYLFIDRIWGWIIKRKI